MTYIKNNPSSEIKLPKKEKYLSKFYSAEDISSLLSKIYSEPLYELISLTVFYGLRRSEALGLKWDCIDFNSNVIHIQRTVVKVSSLVEKEKTKTQSSYRSYPLDASLAVLLKNLKDKQEKNRRTFGKEYIEN